MNTDWGDGGHFNFMEYSWHGYLFGAEQSWNTRAETDSFNRRFNALFLGIRDRAFEKAFTTLGDISTLSLPPWYQSIWKHVFFGTPSDAWFHLQGPQEAVAARLGKVLQTRLQFNAGYGDKCRQRLLAVRREFKRVSRRSGADPEGILPYWIFAVDTLLHATRKLSILGPGGNNTPRNRRSLQREMAALLEQFDKLWHARNRHSEFRITRAAYRRAIRSLD
ncbi:MAG: hypothetical protein GWM98_24060 [Nitrospinaceae bacterium]|nr:hypothetical protein [Nitrospinaceae bacterium]